jgi:hypothetical protein
MFILTVFRNDQNIRMQFGECMSPDAIWKILTYAFDRDEFLSFVRVDEPIERTPEEEDAALDYVDEAMSA